jgi:hypothetical protein
LWFELCNAGIIELYWVNVYRHIFDMKEATDHGISGDCYLNQITLARETFLKPPLHWRPFSFMLDLS